MEHFDSKYEIAGLALFIVGFVALVVEAYGGAEALSDEWLVGLMAFAGLLWSGPKVWNALKGTSIGPLNFK